MYSGRQAAAGGHVPTGYSDSKLVQALVCQELAGRLARDGRDTRLSCYSVCPGWCYTGLARNLHISPLKKVTCYNIDLETKPEPLNHGKDFALESHFLIIQPLGILNIICSPCSPLLNLSPVSSC